MGPRKAFVSNIPYEAVAADLVGFLESVVGEGGIHSAKLKKNGNKRNSGKATVHFEDEEKGELVQQLAKNEKLLFRMRPLRVKLDRAVVQTPKHSLILLENNLLSFACLSKKDEVRVLWSSNPTVNTEFDFATRRLRFLFSVHGTSAWKLEYKMEFIFRDLNWIEPVTIHSTTTTALLLQLNNPPRIYRRKMSLNKESSILLTVFNYLKEEKEEPWVRATDFTSAGCIGQSLAYVIELPGISKEDLDNVVKKLADYKIAPYPYREWKLHLRNGESYASPQMLVPIVEPPVDMDIDFELIFKINKLVQLGRLCGLSLNRVFYKLLEESSHVPRTMHIVELVLQNMMNSTHPCWDPIKQVQNALAKYSRENIRIPSISVPLLADASSIYVHRLLVTPTKVYCQGPDMDFSNRVTRHFANEIHNFLRVSFTDEDYEGITSFALTAGKTGERTQLYDRILRVMQEGLTIGGKHYEFLAFSASQLRDRSFWMFASNERITASEIRAWMGDFLNIRNVAKCAARMGQCFSSSVPTLDVCAHEVEHIPDIERTDYESGTVYCFSDGIGKISEHFARKVVKLCKFKKMQIALPPSAFQIRYGGYKGVVAVDPDLDPSYKIALRPSMRKFTSTHTGLEVLSWSKFFPSYLNRQIIGLLSTLGVKDDVFEEMQLQIIGQLDTMLTDPFMAIEVLQASSSGESQVLTKMLMAGYHPQHEPYLASMLQTFRATQLLNLRTKSRIFVPKGGVLMGCLDETSILEYGQVFLQLTLGRENQRFVDDGLEEFNAYYCGNTGILARVITGPVVVAKNPCVHPGDVRVLMAVDEPSLHHMVNCLVFPQNGDRPHPNECSGSDLDGDLYFVSWDKHLIPPETDAPMDYTPAPEKQLDHPVTVEELQEFFVKHIVNDNLGQISNAHVVHVDLGDDNARSANCKELARLFSVAVDFPKTGVPATIPYLLRPDRYPDFMEKEDKEMYESRKIIGKLFRSVKEASSEKITSQISRDLIWESYDSTLIVLGYEEYVEEASSLKNEYDQKLMGLMNRYGIKTEAEVMSNNILQMSRQYRKRNEDVKQRIQLSVSALCREARQWFFEGDDDNEDHEESRYGGNENYAKASAWYHVTYCADFLDPGEDKYLLSFPWVVYDVLLAIKQGCISHH